MKWFTVQFIVLSVLFVTLSNSQSVLGNDCHRPADDDTCMHTTTVWLTRCVDCPVLCCSVDMYGATIPWMYCCFPTGWKGTSYWLTSFPSGTACCQTKAVRCNEDVDPAQCQSYGPPISFNCNFHQYGYADCPN